MRPRRIPALSPRKSNDVTFGFFGDGPPGVAVPADFVRGEGILTPTTLARREARRDDERVLEGAGEKRGGERRADVIIGVSPRAVDAHEHARDRYEDARRDGGDRRASHMLRSRVGYVGRYTGRSRDREAYPTQQGRSALGSPRGEEHDRADDHGETTHHWRHEPSTLGGDFDGTDVHFLPLL